MSAVRIASLLTLALVAASPGVAQQSLSGRSFADKTHGFKLVLPKDWSPRPIHIDAQRLVGWFHSHRRYLGDLKKGDSDKPEHAILCVVRLDAPVEGRRVHDFEARMRRQCKAGTYKATHRDVEGYGGVVVREWDVRIAGEGLTRKRVRAWVFPRGDHQLSVEFWALEEHFAALEPAFKKTLKSVRLTEAGKLPKPDPELFRQFELRPWLRKPVIERHRIRAAIGKATEARVEEKLPYGWTVTRGKHVLLVSHCDAKVTKRVLQWVELFHEWLDDRFGGLSDDYRIRTVIRLCKNDTEYYAYRRSGGWRVDYNFADREVVMCNDRGNLNMKDVLWAVWRRYMLDAAPEVYFNAPVWLSQAIRGLCGRAYVRRGRLVFPSSLAEQKVYGDLERSGRAKISKPIDLMHDPYFGYVPDKSEMDDDRRLQARVLFRFFDGPGQRCKAVRKDFFLEYCRAIRDLVRELDFNDPKVMVWDSEEDLRARLEKSSTDGKVRVPDYKARWAEYLKLVRKRRAAFNKLLHQRVCNWTDSEWSQVNREYERFYHSKSR